MHTTRQENEGSKDGVRSKGNFSVKVALNDLLTLVNLH